MAARRPTVLTLDAALKAAVKFSSSIPPLCLGSQSASRQALLTATGAKFETLVPNIDEKAIGDRDSRDAVLLTRCVAVAKADALLASNSHILNDLKRRKGLLVTGDQVVTDSHNTIREKPETDAEAAAFINSYARGESCSTVGAICVHDLVSGVRAVGVHTATIEFDGSWPEADVTALLAVPEIRNCAGALMIEHPIIASHATRVNGGLDAVMGLSTQTLLNLIEEVQRVASSPSMLTRTQLKTWAVVGDVKNPTKPASRVVKQLEVHGRTVVCVNPRDTSGSCHLSLASAIIANPIIDAVNLIISPKVGPDIIDGMARLGISDVFIQPGADSPQVLTRAHKLGVRVQEGCVLAHPPSKF